jgi:hypothetical protein
MSKKIQLTLIFISLLACTFVSAQDLTDDVKSFSSIIVNHKLNTKSRLSLGYTGITDLNTGNTNYHQIGLTYRYKTSKVGYISTNVDLISIQQRSTSSFKKYSRFGAGYTHNSSIGRFLIDNDFGGEVFFPKFSKYQYRWIYALDVTYRLNFTKWKIRPYSNLKVYYYSGGDLINYYDDEGDLLALKSPNDIHRWRWYLGVKMRPSKDINVILSYFHNEEFNAGINRFSDINIYNRKKTGIKLPFNSYAGINIALIYNLKFKRKGDDHTDD